MNTPEDNDTAARAEQNARAILSLAATLAGDNNVVVCASLSVAYAQSIGVTAPSEDVAERIISQSLVDLVGIARAANTSFARFTAKVARAERSVH